ncbi:MAG TPA: MFS transporter, partial [Pseudonocardiaceae bacterium]|nr:MFS transporter [Pseudonocardiaceae bacterium]
MTRRRLLMDIGPLQESPAFRRFFIGSGLSSVGSQMTNFAVPLQVFTITHSSAAVGAVGLAIAVP